MLPIKRLIKIFLIFGLALALIVAVCLFFYGFNFSSENLVRKIRKTEGIQKFFRTYDDEDEIALYALMQDDTVLVLNHVRFDNTVSEKIVFDAIERINNYRVFEFIYDANSEKIIVTPLFGYFREKEPDIISKIEYNHDFEFLIEHYKQILEMAEDFPELGHFSYNGFENENVKEFIRKVEDSHLTTRINNDTIAGYFKVAIENHECSWNDDKRFNITK